MKLSIKCDEAGHICDKSQYKEASLWEKIIHSIHLAYCKACRKHTQDNKKLTHSIEDSDIKWLDEETKEQMNKTLVKEYQQLQI
ncbi:hypothetical protein [Mangrovimonas aestuarii]|uniref:hypothetical protein n=1 Tax=Mangrovimonas aestuarii TaxID=3018443 RepID=UPI002379081E|nr:hypothetical protein [Mangrovimonas aestuarii]